MGPTQRDWLGAGALTLVLVILIVLLVASAMGAEEAGLAALRAMGRGGEAARDAGVNPVRAETVEAPE